MGRLREPALDLIENMKRLEQRVRNLETNNRAGYTATDSGSQVFNTSDENKFRINVNGVKQVEVGSVEGTPDIRILRSNGLTALFLVKFGGREIIGLQDGSLHTIFADDAATGFGIARPWIPVTFYDDTQFAPSRTTTSATYVELQYAKYIIQQPFLFVDSLVVCSDGTTGGDISLAVNGELVPDTVVPIPIGSNAIFSHNINFAHYGLDYGAICEVTVQARRTAGAGTVGVRTVHAYGRETPLF